ncbi:MAG: formate-dependent phosphoribosylglycinamide formyltransferase [Candidatus Fibromonas sp.]|jgi:phosphoribosylglycinamide formyltransferase 2|nr:formate-dependent phosphoribosylglycinamide formyltransferase [Candidatus Fibromonas sp.]
MTKFGTPLKSNSKKALLLGSGELGKEVVIELQRFGIETIACDSYENAPAMQVAHRSHVFSMLNGNDLRKVIEQEKPDYIIPEVEAIATDTLLELEKEGYNVIPTAKAARLTMNREGIRRLAAEDLKLKTSTYKFAETKEEFLAAVKGIGIPCVVKPIMSSSGRGQSAIKTEADIEHAWDYSQSGGRAGGGKVIVEGFVPFDYEITLLTVRHAKGTSFCTPIGHVQIEGDYRWSWQPQDMSEKALGESERIAKAVTGALGGYGIFGVELFVKGDEVFFSEVSPRPHDTGMVTLISQDLSEFALHARAILGLPIPNIKLHGPSASVALRVDGKSDLISYSGLENALSEPDTSLRLFGKPSINGHRRLGVVLARGANVDEAIKKAKNAASKIEVKFG